MIGTVRVFCLYLLLCAGFLTHCATGDKKTGSLLFLTSGEAAAIKQAVQREEPWIADAAQRLRRDADAALTQGPWSVMFHPSPAVSGDPHDYFSEGPYWWPDPKNPDGPYIRRDGEVNPDRFTAHHEDMGAMGKATLALSMAGWLFDEPMYADRAAEVIRVWFVDGQTRMNPHLEYGQAIRNLTDGRGIGIIDTRSLIPATVGFAFLDQTGGWDAGERDATRQWMTDFCRWLTGSDKGLDEKKTPNNHATWWGAQTAVYAAWAGLPDTCAMVWDYYRNYLVPGQIQPDGATPQEEKRTRSLSYVSMNLDGFAYICRLAEVQGVNLWQYAHPGGGSFHKAIERYMPFLTDPARWEQQQITPYRPTRTECMALAGLGMPMPELVDAWNRLPEGHGYLAILIEMLVGLHQAGQHRM